MWVNRDMPYNVERLMELFPMGTLFRTNFHEWMPWFAAKYKRRRQDGKPVGVAFLWWKDQRFLARSMNE